MIIKKQIRCKEFEKEVFLFVDGELSNERIKLIEHHLEECDFCKSLIEDVKNLTTAYDALPLDDVEESSFLRMINNVTKSPSISGFDRRDLSPKGRSLVEMYGFYRLTFGGAVVVAAILLIVISFIKEPDIAKRLPTEMLDWHGDNLKNKIEKIENQILSLKSDEWDIYIVRKNKKGNWDATLNSIRKQINKMKKSSSNKKL